jgi:hypothetical protein
LFKENITRRAVAGFYCTSFFQELGNKDLAIDKASGMIGNQCASVTKPGRAGVEATLKFNTSAKKMTVEVLGWYDYGRTVDPYHRGERYLFGNSQLRQAVV